MIYQYFAAKEDKIELLRFVLEETDLRVFDLSYQDPTKFSHYQSLQELTEKFDFHLHQLQTDFLLWSPRHGGKPMVKKILQFSDNTKVKSFQHMTIGVGMIHCYLSGLVQDKNQSESYLKSSTIGFIKKSNNSKGNDRWNWFEIEKSALLLKNFMLTNLLTDEIGELGVLAGAKELFKTGIKFEGNFHKFLN